MNEHIHVEHQSAIQLLGGILGTSNRPPASALLDILARCAKCSTCRDTIRGAFDATLPDSYLLRDPFHESDECVSDQNLELAETARNEPRYRAHARACAYCALGAMRRDVLCDVAGALSPTHRELTAHQREVLCSAAERAALPVVRPLGWASATHRTASRLTLRVATGGSASILPSPDCAVAMLTSGVAGTAVRIVADCEVFGAVVLIDAAQRHLLLWNLPQSCRVQDVWLIARRAVVRPSVRRHDSEPNAMVGHFDLAHVWLRDQEPMEIRFALRGAVLRALESVAGDPSCDVDTRLVARDLMSLRWVEGAQGQH